MATIPFEYRTFWRRFWAGWIDPLVFLPITLLDRWIWAHVSSVAVLGLWYVLHMTLGIAYSVICHAVWGQTVGKRITGVKVMQLSGERLGLKRALLRDFPWFAIGVLGLVANFPTVMAGINPAHVKAPGTLGLIYMWSGMAWFVLELGTMLLNKKRRAVHDLIAGSVVVRVGAASARPATGLDLDKEAIEEKWSFVLVHPFDELPFVLTTPSGVYEARGFDNRPLGTGELPEVVRLVAEAIGRRKP